MVCRWPLGGIRTYLKYVCRYLPENFLVTILAASTQEDEALRHDVATLGARLVIQAYDGRNMGLVAGIWREMSGCRYDLILSQGFISAFNVVPVNLFFRIPHILTIHGILEEKYFSGRFSGIKRAILSWTFKQVDVLYAVSNDILFHVEDQLPALRRARCRKVVIPNGIEVEKFVAGKQQGDSVRQSLGISHNVFLFGFLGRFMKQKGFNYLIDAVAIVERQPGNVRDYQVLAVGSGDYLDHYQSVIRERNLEHRFRFMPFTADVSALYHKLDAVVMPSIWEASGLLAMEALCSGVPLIASNCIGLRETVSGTPAIVFPSSDADALAEAMKKVMQEPMRERFAEFVPLAHEHYDVRNTSKRLVEVINGLVAKSQGQL